MSDSIEDTQLSLEELTVAVEEARARNTYVTAHAHHAKSIQQGLDAGLECFEHGTWLDEETATRMARDGAAIVPTITLMVLLVEHHAAWGVPEIVLPRLDGVVEAMSASLKLAYDAGVKVGSGTDLVGAVQNRRGLEIARKADIMGPMAAIESATRVNAEIMRADELGVLQEGKLADLIAVDGDPLAEPGLLDDPDRVVLVVKGGEIVKNLLET